MRAGIGLISLLLGVGLILLLMTNQWGSPSGRSYLQTQMDARERATVELNQASGRDRDGRPLHESLAFDEYPGTGPMRGLAVESVDPAGPAATHFGLEPGDVILQIGPHDVGGMIVDTPETARDFLDDAFARRHSLRVRRDAAEVTLPAPQ